MGMLITTSRECFLCGQSKDRNPENYLDEENLVINSLYQLCWLCWENYRYRYRRVLLHTKFDSFPVECTFSYREAVKEAVHAAKINSTYHRLRGWQALMTKQVEELIHSGFSFSAVMPSPSSLWSRVRGRLDLAWFLARAISQRCNIPMQVAPFHLHWRYQKQAKRKGRPAHRISEELFPGQSNFDRKKPSLLLIDDVLTSGGTMARLREALPEDENCFGLVLAKA